MGGRERILAAADRFFGTRPYAEVSIAPILAEAEVQAPTLYHHFGDKEGLYVAWAYKAFAPLKDSLLIQHTSNLEDGLAAFANIYYNTARFDVQMVVRDVPQLTKDSSKEAVYNAYFQAVYEPLCALLIEAMERGETRNEPIGQLADVFLASLGSLTKQAEQDPAGTAAWLARRFIYGNHA